LSSLSRFLLIFCVLAATAVLAGLGAWQVQRLQWKEGLIAEVAARVKSPPMPLQEMAVQYAETGDVDYSPVTLSGTFDHSREMYFYTTNEGQAGWSVYAPLILDSGNVALVNRGFVPAELKDPQKRVQGQIEGKVDIEGLARNPLFEKPNSLIPDNDLTNRQFFWKSMADMALAAGLEPDALVPFFVDAGPAPNPGGWPKGGATIIAFPNNHLQYAITWFGLAIACLGVGGWLLFSNRNMPA
jgi:surfeit locus 1 family protein